MNITREWRRFMAVSCSHGSHADRTALDAVIKARAGWLRPDSGDQMVHLGDFTDTLAWMTSNEDGEGEPVSEDIALGLQHLEELGVTLALGGNHEVRLWKHLQSSNQIKAYAAAQAIKTLEEGVAAIGAKFVKYKGVYSTVRLGDGIFTHGTIFNENACRDMAEMYAKGGVRKVISGHTHRCGVGMGRRDDNPVGFNPGTLTREECMDYALTRRATLSWSQGFVYGEYCDDEMVAWLHVQPRHATEWRLPF
jgi:predicted phosphodiesterase